jgi:cell division protein FtsZ
MITLNRPSSQTAPDIRVLGLGGAGGNTLDRLILDGLENATAIALNTDVQSLNGSIAPRKIHLGKTTTRGLGTGGDPEIGYEATEEAVDEIKAAIDGADMIFLCAGLGGGTGSGGAPLIAHLARKAGAVVISFVTLPFTFEGRRRATQAADSLAQLQEQSDLIVCFENDRMSEAVAPATGIQQAFVAADQTLSQSIRVLATLVRRTGLINIGLDELAAALRLQSPRCLFGYGESDGANRTHEALQRALKSPLMDKGRLLADTHAVIVHLAGGPDLTLNEVTVLMDEFNRHIGDNTRVNFGLTTDPKLGKRLCVTIISSTAELAATATSASRPAPARQPAPAPVEEAAPVEIAKPKIEIVPEPVREPEPAPVVAALPKEPEPAPLPVPKIVPLPPIHSQPHSTQPRKTPAQEKTAATAKREEKAEQMQLEPANRGRFEKAEPTIVDGQDLDVPTFLRKNVRVK